MPLSDAFAGRNKARLEKLSKSVRDWGKADKNRAFLKQFKTGLKESCGKANQVSKCNQFIKTL